MGIRFSRLKRLRQEKGFTQEQLADRLGVSRQAVAKWERGESMPDIESCVALADLFGVTVDLLVRGMGEEERDGSGRHLFGLVRLNEKGQITLPAPCRKVFGLEAGDNLLVLGDEQMGIALVKIGQPESEEGSE